MTESTTNTITMVTLSKMLTGLDSKQTMPIIRVAHYGTKEDLITKLAHLAEHTYEGEQQRSVLIMMISDGVQGNAEFNITAAVITEIDNLKWLVDVREVMHCLGTQEDAVKKLGDVVTELTNQFNSTVAVITEKDNLKWLMDVREVMHYLGTQEDAVKELWDMITMLTN